MKLRLLLVHNRYQERGGEDVVFEAEGALLERSGHSVDRLVFDNDSIPGRRHPLTSARLAISTVWSRQSATSVREAVREFRPHVVHFHNTFPLVSPAAYSACKAEGVAVVQTLHNYRLICPNAILFRDGHPCHDCVGRTVPWPGVVHACYRGSRPQSAVVATMLAVHHRRRTWDCDVDVHIALTEFSRRQFIKGGLPEDKLDVKPNFLEPDPGVKTDAGGFFLFVGRLAENKGIDTLLRAWIEGNVQLPLRIVGDGPLTGLVERAASRSAYISYLGRLPRTSILEQMRAAYALVFPSLWYEPFGLVLIEAMACGLPVIASRLGTMIEIIEDERLGLLFTPADPVDLAAKVGWAWAHREELARMGADARLEYEARYTGERNYQMLMEIYTSAIERTRTGSLR